MFASGVLCVGWPVDGFVAVGVEAGAEHDAGFVHVGDDVAQAAGDPVGFGRVDGAGTGLAGCPQVWGGVDEVGLFGELALGCGWLAEAHGPCVEGFEEVAVAVAVECVEECVAYWCGGFGACSSAVAVVVGVGAVDAVVFEVVEVGGEPGEVLAGAGFAGGADAGGVGVSADAAGHVLSFRWWLGFPCWCGSRVVGCCWIGAVRCSLPVLSAVCVVCDGFIVSCFVRLSKGRLFRFWVSGCRIRRPGGWRPPVRPCRR